MNTKYTLVQIRTAILELLDTIMHVETDRSIGTRISEDIDWVDCLQSAEICLRDAYGELGAAIEALGGDT